MRMRVPERAYLPGCSTDAPFALRSADAGRHVSPAGSGAGTAVRRLGRAPGQSSHPSPPRRRDPVHSRFALPLCGRPRLGRRAAAGVYDCFFRRRLGALVPDDLSRHTTAVESVLAHTPAMCGCFALSCAKDGVYFDTAGKKALFKSCKMVYNNKTV